MNTRLTVDLDERQLESIFKLLCLSWTQEYKLRIQPVDNDPVEITRLLQGNYAEAYFAAVYSARAVLLTFGSTIQNESALSQAMGICATNGLYGEAGNLYSQLPPFNETAIKGPKIEADVIAQRDNLISLVDTIARYHERHIQHSIGLDAYRSMIQRAPEHHVTDFLGARSTELIFHPVTEPAL